MNTIKANRTNTKLMSTMFMFMLFSMCSFSGFAQSEASSRIDFNGKVEPINERLESSRATSNMEFALWFMGTKQDPNTTFSTEGASAKKLIITSGMAPNRLLIKAFLKKVVNYENSLS